MQLNEREVLRYAVVLGGFFLLLAIGVAAVDPTRDLAPIDAENVQATLTCLATFAFGVLTWGLLHLRAATRASSVSARLRAWRDQPRDE